MAQGTDAQASSGDDENDRFYPPRTLQLLWGKREFSCYTELLEIPEILHLQSAEPPPPEAIHEVQQVSTNLELLCQRAASGHRYLGLATKDYLKSRMRENRTSGCVRGSRQSLRSKNYVKGVSRLSTRLMTMTSKILIVDDEHGIVDMIQSYFQSQYDILTAYSGQEALQKAGNNPDLILLDINMPDIDGLTVCQKIRDYITCPILFLTARIESGDKIIGFQAGADDYIVKPFDLDELGARIAAHLRREQRRQSNSAVRFFGELALDYSARTATINSQSIPLSKREFEIVELLSLNAGQVFDRERIYELVWGLDGDGNSDTIMEHIRKIRAKFAAHTLHNYIETVWGCGYRWNA